MISVEGKILRERPMKRPKLSRTRNNAIEGRIIRNMLFQIITVKSRFPFNIETHRLAIENGDKYRIR